jgi:HSP20 family molecular chaperone IbpA
MIGQEFDRAVNEVFEDLLIKRWRGPGRIRHLGKAMIVEDDETYRVKIAMPEADPDKLEVEVSKWRLAVRSLAAQTPEEHRLDFSHCIDIERVTARFEGGILEITVPKAGGRKIEVR